MNSDVYQWEVKHPYPSLTSSRVSQRKSFGINDSAFTFQHAFMAITACHLLKIARFNDYRRSHERKTVD